ncbi:MAG: sensor histidine kinase [Acidovorax sp.]|jgi:signal transduction histidine kinase|nr:sensor histidine kinase [Acidovorax sp.]
MKWPAFPVSLSLRSRLLLGTLVWIALSLALAGWGLRNLFQEHVGQQLQDQLVRQLDQLSASVNLDTRRRVDVAPMAGDERLERPLSGLYWQVDTLTDDGSVERSGLARSRSLWDQDLQLPDTLPAPSQGRRGYSVLTLHDSQGNALTAVSRPLQLPDADAPRLRLTVAADQALVAEPLQRFTTMLWGALGLLAAGLLLAVAVQLHLALRPMQLLRQRLADVRTGQAAQLQGQFPQELQPLVNEFNHVLTANADIVQRARTQAGNLAHAVHTPLNVMGNAAAQDASPLAQLVCEQVATATRQVDYHLARARAATAVRATGLRTPVQAPLQALLRTMERLHAGRQLLFTLHGANAEMAVRGEEQDLFEMLGNLLDNAGKWAASQVRLEVQREGDSLCFTVDDDGPGIADDAQRQRIFERGERLDEQRPGSGLGLDIVRELAHTYGGSIEALPSPLGGLRMRLCLPAAAQA